MNHNQLGDTLKATFYSQPALLPHRNGNNWRPKAIIVNEDDPEAEIFGNWELSTIKGFQPNVLIKKDTSYAAISYYFDVPFDAWFDAFAYIVTGPAATDQAPYTVISDNDSATVYLNQKDFYSKGWQPLKSVYLTKGRRKVLKLDNRNVPAGQYVVADAAMIMINRKLSPDVIVTGIEEQRITESTPAQNFILYQNYPNPFNSETKIRYLIAQAGWVTLKAYNILGEQVAELVKEYQSSGSYEILFDAKDLTGGIYFYRLTCAGFSATKKIILVK